jgi:hypothetical protein
MVAITLITVIILSIGVVTNLSKEKKTPKIFALSFLGLVIMILFHTCSPYLEQVAV